jgi:hypothetical protein
MSATESAKQFISDYKEKIQELSEKLKVSQEQAEYLKLEIRMLNEVELPKSQADEVLNGTTGQSAKLKKQLERFKESLQLEEEKQVIYANALSQFKFRQGEAALQIEKLFKEQKAIDESKHYAKMMYFKRQYIEALIDEGQHLKDANSIEYALAEIVHQAGRRNGVYVDSSPKHTIANNGNGRYLALNHAEVTRFILGTHSNGDYNYLKPFSSLKGLK